MTNVARGSVRVRRTVVGPYRVRRYYGDIVDIIIKAHVVFSVLSHIISDHSVLLEVYSRSMMAVSIAVSMEYSNDPLRVHSFHFIIIY